jgi:hypothetical protein
VSSTPHLNLPLLAAAQAQKHVTHNEALMQLDATAQLAVLTRTLTAPPLTPVEGDRHIVATGATGSWSGEDGHIAWRVDGVWSFLLPKEGWVAWVGAEQSQMVYKSGVWSPLGVIETLDKLGINTTADASNKLTVSAERTLLTHAGAGHQLVVNKNTGADTASLVFQTAYSGRAEIGLAGSDGLAVKVSDNGSSWKNAFTINAATGVAAFDLSPNRQELTVITASGSYTVPAWARRLKIVALGGGGGGGSGAAGTSAANRFGGTGGNAGGWVEEEFDVAEVAATLTVTVGAGGTGGAAVTGITNGASGASGGATSVASGGTTLLYAYGGGGGAGGITTAQSANMSNTTYSWPVAPAVGGTSSISSTASAGGLAVKGAGAGGGGGAIDTASVQRSGGAGGVGYFMGATARRANGGAGGAAGNGGSSGFNKAWDRGCGGGGGGGGAGASAANGGEGADGGIPSAGGGGGGATRDNATSGAGGTGGRGEVWIIAMS